MNESHGRPPSGVALRALHAPAAGGRPRLYPYEHELERACLLARAAGRALLRHYDHAVALRAVGGAPVTLADRESSRVLVEGLRRACPGDAVLSEEESGVLGRPLARRVWLVDPLDGTADFLAHNGEFSVMLGLAERGRAVLGVIYAPVEDVLWAGAVGLGAFVERGGSRRRLLRRTPADAPLRLLGSRSHADPLVLALASRLGAPEPVPCGSVGLKCARIAEGFADAYVHPVPHMKAWDLCAPEVILREAGGTVSDCLGEPLRYSRGRPQQVHGVVACAPGARSELMAALAPLYAERAAALAAAAPAPGAVAPPDGA